MRLSRGNMRSYLDFAFQFLLCLAAAVVLLQNMAIIKENRDLRAIVTPEIHLGERLRDIAAVRLDGTLTEMALPANGTERLLIITLSAGCPTCRANQATWDSLAAELRKRGKWKVYWVSRDTIPMFKKYRDQHDIPTSEILAEPVPRTYSQLALHAVPTMVVVGSSGVVEKIWQGRLDAKKLGEIASYFGVPFDHFTPTMATNDRPH